MRKLLFSILLMTGYCGIFFAQIEFNLEAENALLSGEANIVDCNVASGGRMVRGLSNGNSNSLTFKNVDISEERIYFITIHYITPIDRTFTYVLNDGNPNVHEINASGDWCFQGGGTAPYIFQDTLISGSNTFLFYDSPIIDKIQITSDTSARKATTFYISASEGSDDLTGLDRSKPWRSLSKVNDLTLVPGDSLLFKAGDHFIGQLILRDESGSDSLPIFIGAYGEDNKPILDGNGFLSTIHILNSESIKIQGLEIKNDRMEAKPGAPTNLRYGIYFENTYSDGTIFEDFRLTNLTFKNIYPTDQITDDDQTGVHAYAITTSGSWMDEENPNRFHNMTVENCFFTRTGRHATLFKAVNQLIIRDNLFEHVGGAGMVIGNNCSNILVEGNTTRYTGSSIDPRMAGRGSGIWCFQTKNLVVQHNKFMYARGIKDSFGMHIDIGNQNVVYQYNYSEGNEGGFVEILGANINVGYRFNLSIADGWRKRGTQLGRLIWIGGWSGTPNVPIGSDSIFIYNNSVFIPDTIRPRIWIEAATKNTCIYNNIVYASDGLQEVFIKNPKGMNDFDHNIWYGDIPMSDTDNDDYQGENDITENPFFSKIPVTDESGFELLENSPGINKGKLISCTPQPDPSNYFSHSGTIDYFGNEISTVNPPNIGAYNGTGISVSNKKYAESKMIKFFPNPVRSGQLVHLNTESFKEYDKISLQLMDLSGKVILQKSHLPMVESWLDTSNLTSGCYIAKYHIDGHPLGHGQLIIIF